MQLGYVESREPDSFQGLAERAGRRLGLVGQRSNSRPAAPNSFELRPDCLTGRTNCSSFEDSGADSRCNRVLRRPNGLSYRADAPSSGSNPRQHGTNSPRSRRNCLRYGTDSPRYRSLSRDGSAIRKLYRSVTRAFRRDGRAFRRDSPASRRDNRASSWDPSCLARISSRIAAINSDPAGTNGDPAAMHQRLAASSIAIVGIAGSPEAIVLGIAPTQLAAAAMHRCTGQMNCCTA